MVDFRGNFGGDLEAHVAGISRNIMRFLDRLELTAFTNFNANYVGFQLGVNADFLTSAADRDSTYISWNVGYAWKIAPNEQVSF